MSTSSLSHLLHSTESQEGFSPNPSQHRDSLGPRELLQVETSNPLSSAPPQPLPPIVPSLPEGEYHPPHPTHQGQWQHDGPANSATPTQTHTISSLYQCADCKKRYSRPEHLARHIQTHTLGKRFACQVCGKAFARADLLKRHTTNHNNDGDSTKKRRRIDASPSASRVSHACRPCASARVKCEEVKPCRRCQKRGLTCESQLNEDRPEATTHLLHSSGDVSSRTPGADASHETTPLPFLTNALHTPQSEASSMAIKPEPSPYTVSNEVTAQDQYDNHQNNGGSAPFSDFLHNVLYSPSLDPSRLVDAQGLTVLDFCDNDGFELTDMEFGMLDHWNFEEQSMPVTQVVTPQTDDSSVDMTSIRRKLVKIWAESPWRFNPDKDHGYQAQGNLPIPFRDPASRQFQNSKKQMDRVIQDKVDLSSRDKILAIVLSTCRDTATRTRISSSFASAELIDIFVHIFLAAHLCSVANFVHFGTLRFSAQSPEWLAVAAASGAILTPIPALRKFGVALQEAIRLAIPERFEEKNKTITDPSLVQAVIIGQDIGLWSGNRRQMEIAESFGLLPINMMRYRGRFQHSSYPRIEVHESDQGEVLEEKWKAWSRAESWKRLTFHCYTRDAQASMTTLSSPLMSYGEMTLPLPEARELWFAKTAEEWKREYHARFSGEHKQLPSLGDLLRDFNPHIAEHKGLDVQYSLWIYLHAFWSLIYEWRRLCSVLRSGPCSSSHSAGSDLILNSRHQELCRSLSNFKLITSDWYAYFSAQEALLLNLLGVNLYVSLDDLQLFAGKDGEDQARRVYPILQQWSKSGDCRRALWHAGQVLRHAKSFPCGHLKGFYAAGVHHAALALWTYGVVTRARNPSSVNIIHENVYIDDEETALVPRFINFGLGRPMIRGFKSKYGEFVASAIDDPRAAMEIAESILRRNYDSGQEIPSPMVENICHLIQQLGGAAWAVGLG
ncbi:hypothetical protein F5Y18DRAFT_395944 [Xylariaceae sp. FL1019]|nr:hypothetical protein F5Y18DRAFT_395944 [Xylariaceae sp. FL1019]